MRGKIMAIAQKGKLIPSIISFIRQRDFKFIKQLGQGACGLTILVKDEIIDESFVCKKYLPYTEIQRKELYARFLEEIKVLHKLNHKNIVRVFNYYLYPNEYSGYILMEYINGNSIDEYLKNHPERINNIFEQVIEGFAYLEGNKILHRDVRPLNIMIAQDGQVKIIDFGFSKKVPTQPAGEQEKSISLNWWCEVPNEFEQKIYNHRTELYFIGKLFEKIIIENKILEFAYKSYLKAMIEKNPDNRSKSFCEIQNAIRNNMFLEMNFSEQEKKLYRTFAENLSQSLSDIGASTQYNANSDEIIRKLDEVYQSNMLEEYVQGSSPLISCFLIGTYRYIKQTDFPVESLKNFNNFLKAASQEKVNIILSNLYSRFNTISRFNDEEDEDIPF